MGQALGWGQILIAIPTVLARAAMLGELLQRLRVECPGAAVVVREHVEGTSPRLDLPALVSQALQVVGDRPWVLLLEDDAWLAPVFGARVPVALAEAAGLGRGVASFFSRSGRDLEVLRRGGCWRSNGLVGLHTMVAVAVRAELLQGFAEWAPGWYQDHPQHQHAADLLLGAWLSRQRARMLVHVPSLVQHRRGRSMLPGHRGERRSATYAAVFGEAP